MTGAMEDAIRTAKLGVKAEAGVARAQQRGPRADMLEGFAANLQGFIDRDDDDKDAIRFLTQAVSAGTPGAADAMRDVTEHLAEACEREWMFSQSAEKKLAELQLNGELS